MPNIEELQNAVEKTKARRNEIFRRKRPADKTWTPDSYIFDRGSCAIRTRNHRIKGSIPIYFKQLYVTYNPI